MINDRCCFQFAYYFLNKGRKGGEGEREEGKGRGNDEEVKEWGEGVMEERGVKRNGERTG